MASMSCVMIGNESLLVQCAEAALDRGNTIVAVVTSNPDLQDWAMGRGLRVEQPGVDLAQRLADTPFDWLLSIANLSILHDDLLALPSKGAINFHDGPLPRHAGLNAPIWALINGETQHGISWHMIEGGVDEGDVLVSRSFDISATDTALTLNTKAYEAAMASFSMVLDQLETGALRRSPQDLSKRSYHALTDRPMGFGTLDPFQPASSVERLVRALDHGAYWNPLCVAKLTSQSGTWHVGQARIVPSQAEPGTVIEVTEDHLTLACAENAVVLSGFVDHAGAPVDPGRVAKVGEMLGRPAAFDATSVARSDGYWRKALGDFDPISLPAAKSTGAKIETLKIDLPDDAMTCVARWALGISGRASGDLAYFDGQAVDANLILPWKPLRVSADQDMDAALNELERRGGIARDLAARAPELGYPKTPDIGVSKQDHIDGTVLTVCLSTRLLSYDTGRISGAEASLLAARLALVATDPQAGLPVSERDMVVNLWNQTKTTHDTTMTMQAAFEAQVARTPDAVALVFEGQSLTYTHLNTRANQAAHVLKDMGVVPGQIVGLCCRRSIDLMVGALAVLKAGGAYLPMDPAYPADRLRHFVEDSDTRIIVTTAVSEPNLPPHRADLLVLDAEPKLATASTDNPQPSSQATDLAYMIYTSGSTGKPKGVMIEHGNVANFYVGMDACIPHETAGTWLAVTSLSFDISVLELFWTTARGFKVVLSSDEDRGMISNGPMPRSDKGMQYSLYYWGNDDGVGRDKYKLLLDGAKFADDNGFVAVWTPERHFHAFGGPYPNPSVTGAAVAGMTKNIGVRAGSVVSPLHHPARIAEEWAVIDNLTNGQAGLAFASGWQPDDFILRPENTPPENKAALTRDIETVRKLWRGEAVGFPRKDGHMHEVVTQPRPMSTELPVWVTTAGNPKTWEEAGRMGCNVLTHLLGQSVDEVGAKIALYHNALREAGHDPKDFTVTLMLHTFLSDSREKARDIAREPMKSYLRSAAGLIKQYAWAFPAFKRPEGVNNAFDLQLDGLKNDELEAILDYAFERYFNDSGLFGTIEDAMARTEDLQRIGVNEIACLIDYGIDRDTVLEGLKPLARVVKAAQVAPELDPSDFSIAAQIVRHDVTHLQCTPSMARMFAMNDEARFALSGVQHLFLGGEPLPAALVEEFSQITPARITNMYGPTETTIWSSTEVASSDEGLINIGTPLANQQLYVLDGDQNPVGIGQEGELWIGGQGVTRGYWKRPELTAERFVDNPFHKGRMYRTGDLVRRRIDGRIDFVGRVDHQIKLRGFRIELGEIEAALESVTGVTQAVVVAREDVPGDVRLIGYFTGLASESDLKHNLSQDLPSFMVPSRFVQLPQFPLTPNKKVDRNALPSPQTPKTAPVAPVGAVAKATVVPVATGETADTAKVEASIARIWADVLGVQASSKDNFFDLGGHSLLAVQTHRAIRETLGAKTLSITDIFRFPVLGDLAARVVGITEPSRQPASQATPEMPTNARAQSRSEAMARRREMRARRRA